MTDQPAAPLSRKQILEQALAARIAEVESYQINIDNFTLALEIGKGREFFEEHQKPLLTERLQAEKVQQAMAQLILDTIQHQLDAAGA